jgi:hypothetical protein
LVWVWEVEPADLFIRPTSTPESSWKLLELVWVWEVEPVVLPVCVFWTPIMV